MMGFGPRRPDPGLGAVPGLAIGLGGLTTCVTLVFHATRAVMDVGGSCAVGGPATTAGERELLRAGDFGAAVDRAAAMGC